MSAEMVWLGAAIMLLGVGNVMNIWAWAWSPTEGDAGPVAGLIGTSVMTVGLGCLTIYAMVRFI